MATAPSRKNQVCALLGKSSTSDTFSMITRSLESLTVNYTPSSQKLDPRKLINWNLKNCEPSCRSLENCDKYIASRQNSKNSLANEKLLNNNYPNGNVGHMTPLLLNGDSEHDSKPHEDSNAETRLLLEDRNLPELANRSISLDQIIGHDNGTGGGCISVDKKSSARNSIRSWLANLFNGGNGLRSSDASLRRGGVIPGYDNIQQSERESIV